MSATHRLLRFGVFELNLDTEELRKSGVLVKLPPQPFKLLALIAARSGLVVTREEIQTQLWDDGTFVDFEQGMNHCIKQIRTVLSDNANTPLYVETIPRRGYRFLAPVITKTVAAPARVTESASGIQNRVPLSPQGGPTALATHTPPETVVLSSAPVATATATAAALARPPTVVSPPATSPESASRSLWRRAGWFAAIVGIVAISAYLVTSRLRVTVVARPKSIAVLPFETSGQDIALALGLSESIAARLSQTHEKQSFDMVSPRETRDIGIKTAADARERLKTEYVLEGTVEKVGTQVRVTCSLVDTRTLHTVEARTISGDAADLFGLQDKVITETLAMLPGGVPSAPKSAAVTVQPPGYESYLRGRGYLQDYHKFENIQNAIADFTHSLELEPAFAPAHAGLGQAYWMGYDSHDKGKEWLDRAQSECRKAVELDATLAEAHSCMGNYYNAVGQYDGAAQEFHTSVDLDPDNLNAWRGLGRANDKLNRASEAETAYRKATEMSPHYWAPYNWLAVFYYRHGRYADAAQMYRLALDRAPENQRLYYNLAGLYEETGQYDEAIQVSQTSLSKGPTAAAYNNLGNAYFYKHDYRQAEENFRKAVALDDQGYDYWSNLGDALYWSPDRRAAASAAYANARKLVLAKLEVNPNDATLSSYLAYLSAMIGDRREALKQVQRALQLAPTDGNVLLHAAQVYNQLGQRKETLDCLRRSSEHGYSPTMIRDTPDFDALHTDPSFSALLARR